MAQPNHTLFGKKFGPPKPPYAKIPQSSYRLWEDRADRILMELDSMQNWFIDFEKDLGGKKVERGPRYWSDDLFGNMRGISQCGDSKELAKFYLKTVDDEYPNKKKKLLDVVRTTSGWGAKAEKQVIAELKTSIEPAMQELREVVKGMK